MSDQLRLKLEYLSPAEIFPNPSNPKLHGAKQTHAIAASIKAFGFISPIIIDGHRQIVCGHGRHAAAQLIGLAKIPTVQVSDLAPQQLTAYMLADNKLNEMSSWDPQLVGQNLKSLADVSFNFELTVTGFEEPEIDFLINGPDEDLPTDRLDTFNLAEGSSVTCLGDLWTLGAHKLLCADALQSVSYHQLLGGKLVQAVVTDPPYNVKIGGNVSGLGKIKHREFAMASGEMSKVEFQGFLDGGFAEIIANSERGALIYAFMDWRHMQELASAADGAGLEMLNLCIWNKTNGGMGTLYRSKHELVFVFRNGDERHRNNVQLGKFGRNRTNVWTYPGANVLQGKGKRRLVEYHPTVKPVRMISDIMLDCTARNDLVLDPFSGSGTTILAAEKVGRRASCLEIDPLYVDTAIVRWQGMTGQKAIRADGQLFDDLSRGRQ